jgi:predicted enzyme related to lactoylglutathione lyase
MNAVQVEQKSYEMPPREGISIAHFLTVADIERSARYYEKVFGARILSMGDGNAPAYLQLANIWMILNVGGGPTPDKPTVTLSVPDPNHINSFMNFRVADIQACYELWKSRGAEFITPPIPKYGEIRCYIRDPDGYIIEVGQSTDLTYGYAALLFAEGFVDDLLEVVARLHAVGNPLEDIVQRILGRAPEQFYMFGTNRFQADDRTFERQGGYDVERS